MIAGTREYRQSCCLQRIYNLLQQKRQRGISISASKSQTQSHSLQALSGPFACPYMYAGLTCKLLQAGAWQGLQ